jgi:hypothetical protein
VKIARKSNLFLIVFSVFAYRESIEGIIGDLTAESISFLQPLISKRITSIIIR